MIITIKQTKTNLAIEFNVYEGKIITRKGKCNRLNSVLPFELLDLNDQYIYKSSMESKNIFLSMIPILTLFKKIEIDKVTVFNQSSHSYKISNISSITTSYYQIKNDNELFTIYDVGVKSMKYFAVYLNGVQVAMITKPLNVSGYLDQYTLYLLDDFVSYKDLLTTFCLYFDNFNSSNRGEIGYTMVYTYVLDFGINGQYLNPLWLKEHFNLEEIDFKYNKANVFKFRIAFSVLLLIIISYVLYQLLF